jgi:hypothetical protein
MGNCLSWRAIGEHLEAMPSYFLNLSRESPYTHKIRARPRLKFRGDTLAWNSSGLSTL